MSGIQRFLTKRGERNRRGGKQEKESPNSSTRSYLWGLVIRSQDASNLGKEDEQKVKALVKRLASAGIFDLNSEQIRGVLTSTYAQGDAEKAFDLLMILEDSIEGIIRDYDSSTKLVGAVNRMGVTCYLDALLFAMFARLDFFEAILFKSFTESNDPRRRLVIMLRLWVNMLRSGKLITPDITEHLQESLSQCGWQDATNLRQQDASEAFTFITEKLELPLLTLKMDIYHTGKEDTADDHKFINERLLEVAIPPEHADGTAITLEECLEAYFNNKIEVKRYLERRGTIHSVKSFDSIAKGAAAMHVESVEISSSPTTSSPIRVDSPKFDFPKPESFTVQSTLSRRPSIVQERFVPDKDSIDDLIHPGRKRKGSYRKEVMMPAWQFFSLIPWYTDNAPVNDAQVAAHFSSKRPILGLCLKRYSVLPNGNAIRLNTFIDIPIEIGLPHFIQDDKLDEDGLLYGNFKLLLQSVVCHRGNSVDSGHYISLVRGTNSTVLPSTSHSSDSNSGLSSEISEQWIQFDDLAPERITFVDIEKALREESPYLLFYQIVPINEVSLTEEHTMNKPTPSIKEPEDLPSDVEKVGPRLTTDLKPPLERNTSTSARLSFDLSSLPSTQDNTENPMTSGVPIDGMQSSTSLREFPTRRSLSLPRRTRDSSSRSRSRGEQSGEKRLSAAFKFTMRSSRDKNTDSSDNNEGVGDTRDNPGSSTTEQAEFNEQKVTLKQNNGKQRQRYSTNRKERMNPDRECTVM